MNLSNFEAIYSGMIAGRIPCHKGDVEESVLLIARNILASKEIHLLTQIDSETKYCYYFAQKSSVFSSVPEFTTPLAVAFPDHPEHQGDGVYVLVNGGLSAMVIKYADTFKMVVNSSSVINSEIEDLELPVFNVDSATAVVMQSVSGRQHYLAEKISKRAINWSFFISAIGIVVSVGAHIANTALTTSFENTSEKSTAELNAILSKIEHASPLSSQLAGMQKISATVIRAGGWIDFYELKDGKESFQVSLPEWVTQDYVAALGPGAKADHDIPNNLIKVKK